MRTNDMTNGRDGASNDIKANLPRADDVCIRLAHPTSEERLQQLKSNGAEWRGALSLDDYLQREEHLIEQDFTRDGGLTSWVLVDNQDPTKRRVLCGCETYRKKALVASKGVVKATISHGIGSVFCPPEMRGNGYAGRLMKEVGEQLRTWQTDEGALFSILYSDIGKRFYAKHGWMTFPSAHISLPSDHTTTLDLTVNPLPEVKALLSDHLSALCATDESLIRRSLQQEASTSNTTFVALIPDLETIRWHHAREEFVGKRLHGSSPLIKGAMVGNVEGERVWCYWTRMWYNGNRADSKGNTLHILRLVIEEKQILDWERSEFTVEDKQKYVPAVAALLEFARKEASASIMEHVEIWNPNAITVEAAKLLYSQAQVTERDQESICSLRWYGDENALDKLTWLGNEKYGWC